jgi:hypothetical protein
MKSRKQRSFLLGTIFAWVPFIVLAVLVNGVSHPDLASWMARPSKWWLIAGVLAGMAAEAIAIPLLLGAFARGQWTRGIVSTISLCCAAFMTLLFMVLLVVVWLGISQFQPRG